MSSRITDSQTTVAIIGPGRVGQALGRLLLLAGVRIGWVAARRLAAAKKAVRFIGAGRAVTLDSADLAAAGLLLITTSDSALPGVALALAKRRESWKGAIVLHTSGAWPAGGRDSVLQPLRRRGASAASLHPLQTVPSAKAGVRNLIGCFWAIEGDPQGVKLARRWVRALRGAVFTLRPEHKPAYHAAAVIACAGIVTLLESSRRLLERCGVPPKRARHLLEGFVAETAKNFAALGAPRALTGPALRGDWATLRKHFAALEKTTPDLVPLYGELLHSMLRMTGRRVPRGVS
ncbi:MAG TPA: Rossmann-like and DUF2520 domain-containing protein [Terriglobia bacterium]|nr:Rossmann-like and DUF2520 domain-containing protein [Terriglobia bacterium]